MNLYLDEDAVREYEFEEGVEKSGERSEGDEGVDDGDLELGGEGEEEKEGAGEEEREKK